MAGEKISETPCCLADEGLIGGCIHNKHISHNR